MVMRLLLHNWIMQFHSLQIPCWMAWGELVENRERQNGWRRQLLQKSAIPLPKGNFTFSLTKGWVCSLNRHYRFEKYLRMHDKNGAMCFVPVFWIGLRAGREHSEAVPTVFGSTNNICSPTLFLLYFWVTNLKFLQVRSGLLELLG